MTSIVEISFYGYEMTLSEFLDFIEKYYKENFFPYIDSSAKKYIEKTIKKNKKTPNDSTIELFYSIWGAEEGSSIKALGVIEFKQDYLYENATYYVGMYSEDVAHLQDKRIGVSSSLKLVLGEIETPLDAKLAFEQYNLQGYKQPKSLRMSIDVW